MHTLCRNNADTGLTCRCSTARVASRFLPILGVGAQLSALAPAMNPSPPGSTFNRGELRARTAPMGPKPLPCSACRCLVCAPNHHHCGEPGPSQHRRLSRAALPCRGTCWARPVVSDRPTVTLHRLGAAPGPRRWQAGTKGSGRVGGDCQWPRRRPSTGGPPAGAIGAAGASAAAGCSGRPLSPTVCH
jgi:hypothetical protein